MSDEKTPSRKEGFREQVLMRRVTLSREECRKRYPDPGSSARALAQPNERRLNALWRRMMFRLPWQGGSDG